MNTRDSSLRDDEFDIEVFASKVYRVGRKTLGKLLYPLRLLFAKPLRLLLFVILAVAAAFAIKFSVPPVYESSFVIRPSNSGDLVFINMLHDLEQMVRMGDVEALSSELSLDKAQLEKVKKMKRNPVWHGKDSLKLMQIRLWVKDPALFDTLQKSMIAYLENSEHYTRFRRLRKMDIEGMKQKVNADLAEIDSLKRMLAGAYVPRNGGGFVYGEAPDAVRIYESSLSLYRQKLSLNWQEAYVDNFEVMKSCTVPDKPVFPDIYRLLLICIGSALLLCILVNYLRK